MKRVVTLVLLSLPFGAQAACESWMATGSTTWIRECNGGVDPYPQPQEYGTRTDVYLTKDGRISNVYRHQANDEQDETHFYNSSGSQLPPSFELDGGRDALNSWE